MENKLTKDYHPNQARDKIINHYDNDYYQFINFK
jgi:hypothetical protein